MSDLTSHPLYPMALKMRGLSRNQHPMLNPNVHSGLPSDLQKHVTAIANNPALAAVATGGTSPGSSSSASNPTTDALAPSASLFRRLPAVRHQVCGSTPLVLGAASGGTLRFSPQARFKGNRVIFPSSLTAGLLSNLLVGTKPQYAAASQEPLDMFREDATSGLWDLDVCEIGQQIVGTVATTAAQTIYAAIVGEMLDGKTYPALRSPLKRIGFTQNVGIGATVVIQILPQVRFKIRKLVIDDTIGANFVINSFNVGITPQFVSGDPVPAAAFGEKAQDIWLDCDEAYVGNVAAFTVTNLDGAAAHNFQGALLGDVDPRDLAGYSYDDDGT